MAKPKLGLIPSAQGSKFYSVLPSSGVGDFDFTRSGSATRINSQGLIETVGNGVSRLNYPMIDGKVVGCPHHILEPTRTNLITYSEDFSDSSWTKGASTITSNATISPYGSLNADKLVENTSIANHRVYKIISIVNLQKYTQSIFVKKGERRYLQIAFGSKFSSVQWANFDLEDGIVTLDNGGVNAKIENFGNGWYRCSATSTATVTSSEAFYINMINNPNSGRFESYQGDGTSGIYIWGFEVEQGSYPTSYIPTNGSTVTRSAETANGSGDASTFNDSEGVLMAEIKGLSSSDTSNRRLGITKNGTYEGLRLQMDNGTIGATLYDGTTNQYSKVVNIDNSIFNKVAFKYKANDFALWINGIEYHPQSSGITFVDGTLDDLSFDYVGGNDLYSNTKQVQYFDSALTDSELETLTSWVSFSDMANGQLYTIE